MISEKSPFKKVQKVTPPAATEAALPSLNDKTAAQCKIESTAAHSHLEEQKDHKGKYLSHLTSLDGPTREEFNLLAAEVRSNRVDADEKFSNLHKEAILEPDSDIKGLDRRVTKLEREIIESKRKMEEASKKAKESTFSLLGLFGKK